MVKSIICLLLLLIAVTLATPVSAAVITVGATGADQTSLLVASWVAVPGDEIRIIDGGTYNDTFWLNGVSLNASPAPATITKSIYTTGTQPVVIENVNIDLLNAPAGHGVLATGAAGSTTNVTVRNCTIKNCGETGISTWEGGLNLNVNLTVENTVIDNTVGHNLQILVPTRLTMTNCELKNATSASSIGLFVAGPASPSFGYDLRLNDVQILNSGIWGVYLASKTYLEMTDCLIENPAAHCIATDGDATDSTLMGNNLTIRGAGGVNAVFYRPLTIKLVDSLIENPGRITATQSNVIVNDGSSSTAVTSITLLNTTLRGATSHNIEVQAKSGPVNVTLKGSTFEQSNGQELRCTDELTVPSTINYNIEGCKFNRLLTCTALNQALLEVPADGSRFVNNVLDMGVPSNNGRTGLLVKNGSIDIYHNVFVAAPKTPVLTNIRAIRFDSVNSKTINVRNNIFSQGSITTAVDTINTTVVDAVSIDYNLLNPATNPLGTTLVPRDGGHNIVGQDPRFILPSTIAGLGDYRVQSASPAVNAGDPAVAVATDFFGTARPFGAAPDMGIYEFVVVTGAPRWTLY